MSGLSSLNTPRAVDRLSALRSLAAGRAKRAPASERQEVNCHVHTI
jgi:hypothetical protein